MTDGIMSIGNHSRYGVPKHQGNYDKEELVVVKIVYQVVMMYHRKYAPKRWKQKYYNEFSFTCREFMPALYGIVLKKEPGLSDEQIDSRARGRAAKAHLATYNTNQTVMYKDNPNENFILKYPTFARELERRYIQFIEQGVLLEPSDYADFMLDLQIRQFGIDMEAPGIYIVDHRVDGRCLVGVASVMQDRFSSYIAGKFKYDRFRPFNCSREIAGNIEKALLDRYKIQGDHGYSQINLGYEQTVDIVAKMLRQSKN